MHHRKPKRGAGEPLNEVKVERYIPIFSICVVEKWGSNHVCAVRFDAHPEEHVRSLFGLIHSRSDASNFVSLDELYPVMSVGSVHT